MEPHLIDAEFRKAWMPFLCQSGHPVVTVDQFLTFVDPFLPQEAVIDLPRITGEDLLEVAGAKRSTAGGMDGPGMRSSPCPFLGFLINVVELTGDWLHGLLDVFFAMIPKADGDSALVGQRPLSVLPVVFWFWASLRLSHLKELVQGWVPQSVFSLGNGLSSAEAWFSTALDIEVVLAGAGG